MNILRRLSRAGILRSVANSDHSRKMSSTGAVKSPWVYVRMHPIDYPHINFYCLAKKEVYSFFGSANWYPGLSPTPPPSQIMLNLSCFSEIVGSSHGWLVWYDQKRRRPFLLDPTTDRRIDLPSLSHCDGLGRLIFEEKSRLAFMTFGSKIAFCSAGSSNCWTLFNEGKGEGGRIFDDLVYSSRHGRLFCLVGEENKPQSSKLECWKVDQREVELEWTMEMEVDEEKKNKKLKYIVCDEDTGEVYLVVRHVEVNMDNNWSWYEHGNKFSSYTTLDIIVYRIDWERRKVMVMEDSLNGLSIFVGKSHSFAMVASEVPGLNPDSVYFSSDDRLSPPEQVIHDKYDHHKDITGTGVFDYIKKTVSPLFNSNLIVFQWNAFWFTPSPISNT